MSTDALRIKFHEQLLTAKKDRFFFALGVLILVPLLVLLIAFVFFGVIVFFLVDWELTEHFPSLTTFCAIFAAFFFVVGLWEYRRTSSRPVPSDSPWADIVWLDFIEI